MTRLRRIAALFLLIVLTSVANGRLSAQSGTNAANAVQQTGSVDGRVTNAGTGDLIPGATLHLVPLRYVRNGGRELQVKSQADGSFRFESVPPGEYVVTAEAENFVPNQLDTSSRFLNLAAGQEVSDVNVLLTPEGGISGKVDDEDGQPLGGIRVEAVSRITTRGKTSLKQATIATADAAGNFHLGHLAPGEYYVIGHPVARDQSGEAGQKGSVQKEGELVRTIYPRALDFDAAAPIQVAAGQAVTDISLRIRRVATYHVKGVISEPPPGDQVQKMSLSIAPRGAVDSPSLARSVQPLPDRTFDISHVVPGAYTLRLTGGLTGTGLTTGGRRHLLLARQDVEVGASDLSDVALTITLPISVAGHISLIASAAAPAGTLSRVRLFAKPLEDLPHSSQVFGTVNPDGTFSLAHLDPGLYVINTVPNIPGVYVKSVSLNQQDVSNKEVDFSGGGAGQLDIVLSSGAGEVDGTVQSDSDPTASGAAGTSAIVLVPERVGPDGSGVIFGYARNDGTFAVPNVAPGKYLVYAVDRADPNLWQNPDFLREMESAGTALQVDENSRQQLLIKLVPPLRAAEAAGRLGLSLH